MKRKISFIVFIISVFLLSGCYPHGPEYAEEMDVVLTKHNDTYNFASKGTYAMPDKIVKITGNVVEGEEPEFVPDNTGDKILARIDENMRMYGWTKVDVSENPDMLLEPAAWETTTVYYYYDYWYYWWYGGYYPYWPYSPPVYYSAYTTGTLLMTLIDPDMLETGGNPVKQWSGAINGLFTGMYDESRVYSAIDKAYTISPYLKTN